MSFIQVAAVLGALTSSVAAHGRVQGIVAGGVWYEGYDPSFQYQNPAPNVIGWTDPADQSNGFVQDYNGPDIICHLNATNAMSHAVVAAGDQVEFQWTVWPDSHHGPVLTYLANCNGPCESVDKTTLEFFKIDEGGLVSGSNPGTWASDQLIANNNSYVVNIPSSIAPGNYVARHEIIALHSAGTAGGAQPYPQCFNLQITGTGSEKPAGTPAEKLYSTSAPGMLVNIYQALSTYVIPGPSVISGATHVASQTAVAIKSNAIVGVTGSAAATPVASATSSAAVTSVASSAASSAIVSSSSSSSTVITAKAVVSSSSSSVSAPTTTAAPASSAVSAALSSAYTQVAGLSSQLPSAILTSILPTAVPTLAPSATANTTLPSKALPQGMTFMQLLEWIDYLVTSYFAEEEAAHQDKRVHARDIHINKA